MQAKDTPLQGSALGSAPAVDGLEKTCITVCLGSSCFTRGNDEHLPQIQEWLARKGLTDDVTLKGSRCEGKCMRGPNLKIDGTLVHDVSAAELEGILGRVL